MMNMKAAIICGIVIIVAGTLVWQQHQAQVAGREENRALRQELEALAAENGRLSNQVSQAGEPAPGASSQERELMRLRSEVGTLKRQLAEALNKAQAQARASAAQPPATQAQEQTDPSREMAITKMTFAKSWMLAFMQYAQQHGGQLPPDFESAAQFAPPGTDTNPATTAQFEIMYKGAISEITNARSVIVVREREAWQTPNGGWAKGYGFADGHSEIHTVSDGNFQTWEAQHIAGSTEVPQGQ